MKRTLEKSIAKYLVKELDLLQIEAIPFSSKENGEPDYLCFPPWGISFFVETKRPKNGKLSRHQMERIQHWWDMGYDAFICSTKEDVDFLCIHLFTLRNWHGLSEFVEIDTNKKVKN